MESDHGFESELHFQAQQQHPNDTDESVTSLVHSLVGVPKLTKLQDMEMAADEHTADLTRFVEDKACLR